MTRGRSGGAAASQVLEPSVALGRPSARIPGIERTNRSGLLAPPPVSAALREDGAERAGNPDRLIQLLDGALDVVVGFEHGVRVQNKLDVGIELTRLALDRFRRRVYSGRG